MEKVIHGLMIDEDIITAFTFNKAPTQEMVAGFEAIADAGMFLAQTICNHAPGSADRTIALQHVKDARSRANMAIATSGRGFNRA